MRRELHIVYGKESQGWEESATGWRQVDPDDWARDSYKVVEWPSVIPEPVKDGPPRELW
jgi:hypothetical protein